MKPLGSDSLSWQNRLSGKRKIFFLDFDGTLSPIVKNFADARPVPGAERILNRLSTDARCRVVIISGRPVRFLKKYLRIRRGIYVGNHGLEVDGLRIPGLPGPNHPSRRSFVRAACVVQRLLAGYRGIRWEFKGPAVAIHYRGLKGKRLRDLKRRVEQIRKLTDSLPLSWQEGKCVWELRLKTMWDKGKAAHEVFRRFAGYYPVLVGDDVTDESMFSRFRTKGLTVRVGRSPKSQARYFLKSPKTVIQWLAGWASVSRERV